MQSDPRATIGIQSLAVDDLLDVELNDAVENYPLNEDDPEEGPIVTKKELWGWYMYDWANSVYLNSVLGSFMPGFLTALAFENAKPDAVSGTVNLMGFQILPSSYYTYCASISVVCQIIVFLSIGALADFGSKRKAMLLITAFSGSAITIAIIGVTKEVYWLGGLILVLSNILFGSSVIFYNSFLPLISKNHPKVRVVPKEDTKQREEVTTRLDHKISAMGMIVGYVAGVIMLLIDIGIFLVAPRECKPRCQGCPNEDTNICPPPPECPSDYEHEGCDDAYWAYRIVLSIAGLWWFAFTFFFVFWVPTRGSRDLPQGEHYLTYSLKQVYKTFKQVKTLPQTFRFLLGYWFFSDGLTAVSLGASLLAVQELSFTGLQLGILFLITNVTAPIGNYLYVKLHRQKRFPYFDTKVVLLINIFFCTLVPLYPRLPGALTTATEFYLIGVVYGLHLGSVQSFARVLLARLTPKGHESEFFSFFELTDKGTSWVSPLIVGIVNDLTGDLRWAVLAIVPYTLIGFIIIFFVKEKIGVEEVRNFELIEKADVKAN